MTDPECEGPTTQAVLLVDDDGGDALVARLLAQRPSFPYVLRRCRRLGEALDVLAHRDDIACLLLDLDLPDASGFEAVERLAGRTDGPPVVVLTGRAEDRAPLEALRRGAEDYVPKGAIDGERLEHVVRYAVERHRVRQALREEEQLSRDILNALSANVAVLDSHGRIRAVNAAWQQFAFDNDGMFDRTGPGTDYLAVCDASAAAGDASAAEAADGIRSVLTGRTRAFELEYECSAPTEERWFSMRVVALRTPQVGAVALHVPITELKLAEAQLLQAQKMESIGRLAGGVAHDFNNILQAIYGFAHIAADAVAHGPGSDELNEIILAAQRASHLTRQLLLFARAHPTEVEAAEVTTALDAFETIARRLVGEHIELHVGRPEQHLWVPLGRNAFEQVMLNLVVNARDALPDGGALAITASAAGGPISSDRADGPELASRVQLRVRDTGTGMDRGSVDRAFEPFFTTKEPGKGTGLGLATVYGLVHRAGGTVSIESVEGAGTEVIVELPVTVAADEAPGPAPPREHVAVDTLRGCRVLVAEDDPTVRSLARRILGAVGCDVVVANDGRQALDKARADGDFDLVVTDMVMPHLSGPELVASLDGLLSDPAYVFISGYPEEVRTRDRLPFGSEVAMKPLTPSELLDRAVRAVQRTTLV